MCLFVYSEMFGLIATKVTAFKQLGQSIPSAQDSAMDLINSPLLAQQPDLDVQPQL